MTMTEINENFIVMSDSADILHVSDGTGRELEPLLHSYCMDHRVLRMEIDCMGGC